MVAEELKWESSLGWCRYMCEERAKTELDTAVFSSSDYFNVEYFYL